jgi:hypothetical protein
MIETWMGHRRDMAGTLYGLAGYGTAATNEAFGLQV